MIDVKWEHDKSVGKVVATIEVDEETFFRARFTGMDTIKVSEKLETLAKIARESESGDVVFDLDQIGMSQTGMLLTTSTIAADLGELDIKMDNVKW